MVAVVAGGGDGDLQAQTELSVLATYVADCDLSRVTIP